MQSRFVSQPYADGFDLRDFLLNSLRSDQFDRLDVAVAWARRSGLRVVRTAIEDFRRRGGQVRMIVGISVEGATKQGLELAKNLSDEAYVLHDRRRTFHPKSYLARGANHAAALVGSHNLTSGGTIRNFEAGVILEADLSASEDAAFIASMAAYYDRLVEDESICKRLDDELLATLAADPAFGIQDEDSIVRRKPAHEVDAKEGDGFSLFGQSRHSLRNVPAFAGARAHMPEETDFERDEDVDPESEASESIDTDPHLAVLAPTVVKRWFKKMSRSDAQQLRSVPGRPRKNPSGHLTLVQYGHPIRAEEYFREDFFSDEDWRPVMRVAGGMRERASVSFDIYIDGAAMGVKKLELDQNPAFGSEQGNRVATLRWGPLNAELRARDFTDRFVTLEKYSDGSYRLSIDAAPTGTFLR